MRYYVDCEFDGHSGPLLSIALVKENGEGIHIQTYNVAKDPWVISNVMPLMDSHAADEFAWVDEFMVGPLLRAFIGCDSSPFFVADSPVDIGRLCRCLTTNEAGGWQPCGYEKMGFAVHNVDCYPTSLDGAVQHNAWWDAMALRDKLSA